MLRTWIEQELLRHLRSFRFVVCTSIAVLLAVLATWAAVGHLELRLRTHRSAVDQHRADLTQANVYSYLQPVLSRPPEPLGVLAQGFERGQTDEVRIDVFSIPTQVDLARSTDPYLRSGRSLDLTGVVATVLGLLAVLLTFDAVIGEVERGNLQLILAHGVARSTIIAGKALGAFAALVIALAISLLPSLVILARPGDPVLDLSAWARVATLVAVYAGYLGVMTLGGLLLSTLARRAETALLMALVTWLAVVFVVPQAAQLVAVAVAGRDFDARQTEAEVEALERERDRELEQAWRSDPLRAQPSGHASAFLEATREHAVLRRYGSARYYRAVARYHRLETALGMRYAERIFVLRRADERRQEAVERLAAVLASPSPAYLLDRIAESLAGTSIANLDTFFADSRRYRDRLIDFLRARGAFESWRWFTDDREPLQPWPALFGLEPEDVDEDNIAALSSRFRDPAVQERWQRDRSDPARRLALDGLPVFEPTPPSLRRALGQVRGALSALVTIAVALAIAGIVRMARYRPRIGTRSEGTCRA